MGARGQLGRLCTAHMHHVIGGSGWVEAQLLHQDVIGWAKPSPDTSHGRLFGCEKQSLSLIDLGTIPNAFYGT